MQISENILSREDAKELDVFRGKGQQYFYNNFPTIIREYVEKVGESSKYPINYQSRKSYWEVQHRPQGHIVHYDTGSSQHMLWCGYSSSTLLSFPQEFEGGLVHFWDEDNNKIRTITPEEHYLSALHYRSNQNEKIGKHSVDSHKGMRVVLLIFMECFE